jgi:hypothetical protein
MRSTALIAAFVGGLILATADARAQLVPISECGSAIPCNIPKGLRPADAAALSPNGRPSGSNAAVGVRVIPAEGFKPEPVTRAIAEDPSERAARIFYRRNPGFAMPRTAPTPSEPGIAEKEKAKTPDAAAPKTERPQDAVPPPSAPAAPVLPDR